MLLDIQSGKFNLRKEKCGFFVARLIDNIVVFSMIPVTVAHNKDKFLGALFTELFQDLEYPGTIKAMVSGIH